MQIFRRLASYSYGKADVVRRIMAKKKTAEMEKERLGFISGCEKNSISKERANEIFDDMASFASYAFCKSHAAAYAYTSYRCAYLKCHYPAEYFASLLTSVAGNGAKTAEYVGEAVRMGVEVKGPDVNLSGKNFTTFDNKIIYGISGIKNIGNLFAETVIENRNSNGRYLGLDDFIRRLAPSSLNKTQLFSLISAGAFDFTEIYRSRLLAVYESYLSAINEQSRREVDGQMGLFGGDGGFDSTIDDIVYPELDELPTSQKINGEKEMMGMCFSGHLTDDYTLDASSRGCLYISDFNSKYSVEGEHGDKQRECIWGIISRVNVKKTSSGDTMAFVTVEDRYGECEVIFFKNQYSKFGSILAEQVGAYFEGTVSLREDQPAKLLVNTMELLVPNSRFSKTDLTKTEQSRSVSYTDGIKGVDEKNKKDGGFHPSKVYIKLPNEKSRAWERIIALADIFKGSVSLIMYTENDKKYKDTAKGINLTPFVLQKAKEIAGDDNVVVK